VNEKLLTERESIVRINPSICRYFINRDSLNVQGINKTPSKFINIVDNIDESKDNEIITLAEFCNGTSTSPGVVHGKLAFTEEEVLEISVNSPVIYVNIFNKEIDQNILKLVKGVAIINGGSLVDEVSVICRALNKPCITNISCNIDPLGGSYCTSHQCTSNAGKHLHHNQTYILTNNDGEMMTTGDIVTIDGSNGKLLIGENMILDINYPDDNFDQFLSWTDKFRQMLVYSSIKSCCMMDIKRSISWKADGV
jgi:phosphohistidine swiveling domain-containing protein